MLSPRAAATATRAAVPFDFFVEIRPRISLSCEPIRMKDLSVTESKLQLSDALVACRGAFLAVASFTACINVLGLTGLDIHAAGLRSGLAQP